PLAPPLDHFTARLAARRCSARTATRTAARTATERLAQLRGGDGGRAALHDHDATGHVGERRGLQRRRAAGQRQREGADDGVAGAGDVGDLVGAVDRDERGRAVALEQGHAAAAARDEEEARVEPLEELAACLLALAPARV